MGLWNLELYENLILDCKVQVCPWLEGNLMGPKHFTVYSIYIIGNQTIFTVSNTLRNSIHTYIHRGDDLFSD